MSLPVWGEWIEIESGSGISSDETSLPVWGEWIEISIITAATVFSWVSPRVGRVD